MTSAPIPDSGSPRPQCCYANIRPKPIQFKIKEEFHPLVAEIFGGMDKIRALPTLQLPLERTWIPKPKWVVCRGCVECGLDREFRDKVRYYNRKNPLPSDFTSLIMKGIEPNAGGAGFIAFCPPAKTADPEEERTVHMFMQTSEDGYSYTILSTKNGSSDGGEEYTGTLKETAECFAKFKRDIEPMIKQQAAAAKTHTNITTQFPSIVYHPMYVNRFPTYVPYLLLLQKK